MRSKRERPPRNLVQIVGQCDDQPNVGADSIHGGQAPRRSINPRLQLATVGAEIGCPISETAEDRMAVTARLGAFKSSMLQDVEAGRPIELEALLGAPREIAQRAGVPTPQLDRIYAMTRLMGQNLGLL